MMLYGQKRWWSFVDTTLTGCSDLYCSGIFLALTALPSNLFPSGFLRLRGIRDSEHWWRAAVKE